MRASGTSRRRDCACTSDGDEDGGGRGGDELGSGDRMVVKVMGWDGMTVKVILNSM